MRCCSPADFSNRQPLKCRRPRGESSWTGVSLRCASANLMNSTWCPPCDQQLVDICITASVMLTRWRSLLSKQVERCLDSSQPSAACWASRYRIRASPAWMGSVMFLLLVDGGVAPAQSAFPKEKRPTESCAESCGLPVQLRHDHGCRTSCERRIASDLRLNKAAFRG